MAVTWLLTSAFTVYTGDTSWNEIPPQTEQISDQPTPESTTPACLLGSCTDGGMWGTERTFAQYDFTGCWASCLNPGFAECYNLITGHCELVVCANGYYYVWVQDGEVTCTANILNYPPPEKHPCPSDSCDPPGPVIPPSKPSALGKTGAIARGQMVKSKGNRSIGAEISDSVARLLYNGK